MASILFLLGCILIATAGFMVAPWVGVAVTGALLCGISVGLALAQQGGS